MKKLITFLAFVVFISNYLSATEVRQKINLNREWKFKLGDYGEAKDITYNDSEWDNIGLPHSFSIPYFMSKDFYVGYGWYRKTLNIPKDYIGKKISIEFEGAFQVTELFVNGKKVGQHKGGYTGFIFDITDYIKEGDNKVAVRVNNLWNARLAPRAGEHAFSGGIYRDVFLNVTNPVHIAWYGTFVTTPEVSKEQAIVNIKTEIKNEDIKTKNIELISRIYDPSGKIVSTIKSKQQVLARQSYTLDQTSRIIKNPQLWHFDSPNLYKIVTEVSEGGNLVDNYETVFGIRWFEWTSDKGFFLNGQHVYLKGANVHQDHAGWGDAVTDAGIRRDVQMVKDAGFNLIRGSHYPHDPAFSRACDEIGLLFWPENAIWGTGGFSDSDGYWNASAYPIFEEDEADFNASAKQQLTELIRIHRNHPSIIVWSMCNEPFFTASKTLDNMKKLLRESVELTHLLDPTRPAAIGGAQRPLSNDRIDKLGDIAGYNGDGGVLPDFQNPGIPNMVSEYGSVTADRPGEYDPGWGDLAKNDSYKGYPWRSGQAVWCAFDHGSIAGSALGKMGIVDYFRIPKRAWYWYRNEYMGIAPPEWPVEGKPAKIVVQADKTKNVKTDGTDDVMLTITIQDAMRKHISNSPSVTLDVISGPGEFPTGSSITFSRDSDIRILDGLAAIEFRSYYAGETVIRATSEGLPSTDIKINFVGNTPYVEGVTPKTLDRVYKRFTKEGHPNIIQTFGQNNPTFPSSSSINNTGGKATDGDKNTWWEAASNDSSPYWVLDTERGLSITGIKIWFPQSLAYKYVVEVSNDKIDWLKIYDNSINKKNEKEKHIAVPNNTKGRFVRLRFTDNIITPQIAEVEVLGSVNE